MKKLILDLDNTIYPVSSIGEKLFRSLFDLISKKEYGFTEQDIEKAKIQIMRIPFQKVAHMCKFPETLTQDALELLRNLRYDNKIEYFIEYNNVKGLKTDKFLLTTGFTNLQQSKIRSLDIENDFKEIFIVDPDHSNFTKKDIMMQIMDKYQINKEELLVVGDDPESEIKSANELNIKTFLLDTGGKYSANISTYSGKTLTDVIKYV